MSESVRIQVNGETREVPAGLNIEALLAHLGLAAHRVAIERNLNVLPHAEWSDTVIAPGDRYEIVYLVGGGLFAPAFSAPKGRNV